MKLLNDNFKGIKWELCNEWFSLLPIELFNNKPINYLEIGTLCGANVISVYNSYGTHKDSKLYCIDPWEDYEEYEEYQNIQSENYLNFLENINNLEYKEKIIYFKNYSNIIISNFLNNYFDIIYIDGNHNTKYVLEDAVLSFIKLKKEGYIIFDDYDNIPTKKGIDLFLIAYEGFYIFTDQNNNTKK